MRIKCWDYFGCEVWVDRRPEPIKVSGIFAGGVVIEIYPDQCEECGGPIHFLREGEFLAMAPGFKWPGVCRKCSS